MLTAEQIKQTVSEYFRDKPVKKGYLFGSYAREEANEESDVDLDYEKGIGWQFFGWNEELKEVFRRKTDIIANAHKPEHTSNWRLLEKINQDKVLLYERAQNFGPG